MVGNSIYTKTAGAVRLGVKNNIVEPKMPGLRKERGKGNKGNISSKSSIAMPAYRKLAVAA